MTDAVNLPQTLAALREQERLLRYPERFGAHEALELGCAIAALAEDYDRGIGVRIYREEDDLVLFQWMMDDKAARNLTFIEGKRRAALTCGHCSLWAYADHEVSGAWNELFDPASGACPVGGAFPVRLAAGEWVATVSLSGLHEGKDHELVVRALCHMLGKQYGVDVPVYPGVAR